jgi:putative tryptophan/tyrosine transport system substrate-binding protein
MRRREFIAGLGSAVAWPVTARAQQAERVRRIGLLLPQAESDATLNVLVSGFIRGLEVLGWVDARNLHIDIRWGGGNSEQMHMFAKELVDAKPDLIVVVTIGVTRAVQQLTQTIPIVIVGAGDPLSAGLVSSLSHPGGNTTGITDIFTSLAGKWLELLKQAVPHLARVALLFNPIIANEIFVREVEEAAAQAGSQYDVKVALTPVRNAGEN